jgi:hypothetical protein
MIRPRSIMIVISKFAYLSVITTRSDMSNRDEIFDTSSNDNDRRIVNHD